MYYARMPIIRVDQMLRNETKLSEEKIAIVMKVIRKLDAEYRLEHPEAQQISGCL